MKSSIELDVILKGVMVPAKTKPTRSNAYDYEPAYVDKFQILCHDVDITSLVSQETLDEEIEKFMVYLESETH